MQYQVNQSQIRNSHGFAYPEGFPNKNTGGKGFPVQTAKNVSTRQDELAQKIQDLDDKNEGNDVSGLRRKTGAHESPFLPGKAGSPVTN